MTMQTKTYQYCATALFSLLLTFASCGKTNNPDEPTPAPTPTPTPDTIAAPHWVAIAPEVTPKSWAYDLEEADISATMTITALVTGSNTLALSQHDKLGWFLGDQCLMMDSLRLVYTDCWRAFVVLPYYPVLDAHASEVYVAYYNALLGSTFYWHEGVSFVADGELGTFSNPHLLDVSKAEHTPYFLNISMTMPMEVREQYMPQDEMAVFVGKSCRAIVDITNLPASAVCNLHLPMATANEDITVAYYSARKKRILQTPPMPISASPEPLILPILL